MKAKKAGAKSSPSSTSSASKAGNKNTQDIENLIGFVSESGLAEVNIETSEFKLHIKRYADAVSAAPVVMSAPVVQHSTPVTTSAATSTPAASEKATESSSGKNQVTIKSPMIGTFYRSANPESGPFVNVGDEIKAGQPVCIIEAMKLFNEIEAEISGKIIKILVDNASPVEYDQPLFLIEPK